MTKSKVNYQFNIDELKNLKLDSITSLKVRRNVINKILQHESEFLDKKSQDAVILLKSLYYK
ncbi:MAG: hypothetical protein RLZZ196_735 [Bacteroidota bacterium]|jgi:hypothetical protein